MEKYEFFILPVNQVLPFDVKMHYPTEIAGVKMENYIAWMKSAYYISTAGNPAISVPCAFSSSGLPIGIQIGGRHNDDWACCRWAYASSRRQISANAGLASLGFGLRKCAFQKVEPNRRVMVSRIFGGKVLTRRTASSS